MKLKILLSPSKIQDLYLSCLTMAHKSPTPTPTPHSLRSALLYFDSPARATSYGFCQSTIWNGSLVCIASFIYFSTMCTFPPGLQLSLPLLTSHSCFIQIFSSKSNASVVQDPPFQQRTSPLIDLFQPHHKKLPRHLTQINLETTLICA